MRQKRLYDLSRCEHCCAGVLAPLIAIANYALPRHTTQLRYESVTTRDERTVREDEQEHRVGQSLCVKCAVAMRISLHERLANVAGAE